MPGLTKALAAFIAAPVFAGDYERACGIARQGITDTIATTFAGASEPVTRIVVQHGEDMQGANDAVAPVYFSGASLPLARATCVNGTAGHALDYDDVAMSGHPSVALTPAILAQAHALAATGEECLRAYIVGYEVWAELASREPDPYHLKGWHPTAVFGTVAATAAVAYLRRLPEETIVRALAIAASMASGLVANFGTMTKPLHAGRAGALAFEAISYAELGLTASSDALEHPAGFLKAISPQNRVDRDRPASIGKALRIVESGVSIKRYPVCYSGHRIIDGAIEIAQREDLDPASIESVVVSIGRPQAGMLRNAAPTTALEAKFSAEFAIASALVKRKVGLSELNDDFVNRDIMRTLYGKVSVVIDDEVDPLDSAFALNDKVSITLQNGRKFDSGDIRFPRGHAHLPMSDTDLATKFKECMAVWRAKADKQAINGVPADDVLYARLNALKDIANIQTLFRA